MAAHLSIVISSPLKIAARQCFIFQHFEQLFLHLQEYAFEISPRQLFEVVIKHEKGLLCLQFVPIHGI